MDPLIVWHIKSPYFRSPYAKYDILKEKNAISFLNDQFKCY